jgi:serine protease Do
VPAEVVGVAPQFDLALLQVPRVALEDGRLGGDTPRFVPVEMGNSEDLLVGEWAIAIGHPFGFELASVEPSVSVGVVSAVQRDLPTPDPWLGPGPYVAMIQTDAAIHVGNSGGPLVNASGQVVGVNTVSYTNLREGGSGVHFAIPINTARWVARELHDYGEVRKPWIGWRVTEVTPDVRSRLNLPEEEGVLRVAEVVRDGPAYRAGIRAGDILYKIRGLDPYSLARAERILFGTLVDSEIQVMLLRDGQLLRAMVHVIEDPYARAEREARGRRPVG